MRKLFFLIFAIFFNQIGFAQQTASDIIRDLNKTITLYSADNAALFAFYEEIGTIEQKTNSSTIQRIRLTDIGFINVESNAENFIVNIRCTDSTFCMNLIKSDMTSTSIPSNAFFFTEATAANTFAKKLEELVALYPSDKNIVKAILLSTKTSSSNSDKEIIAKTSTTNSVLKSKEIEEDEELDADEKEDLKKSKQKSKLEFSNDTDKSNSIQKNRTNKSKKSKTENEINEDENEDIQIDEKKKNRKNDIEVDPISNPMDSDKGDGLEPICLQLMNIIKAGKQSKFKEIEGKETNPTTKINESKIHIKGAKRNYLSWFRKERAFIAEYKTSSDRELILIEFEKLQTQLENCLEGGWEDSDHSKDEMYSNTTEEVKDVEYKSMLDLQCPSLRIMLNTDKSGKHTLFIRIQ